MALDMAPPIHGNQAQWSDQPRRLVVGRQPALRLAALIEPTAPRQFPHGVTRRDGARRRSAPSSLLRRRGVGERAF